MNFWYWMSIAYMVLWGINLFTHMMDVNGLCAMVIASGAMGEIADMKKKEAR